MKKELIDLALRVFQKGAVISFVIFSAMLFCTVCPLQTMAAELTETYTSDDVSFRYPKGWLVTEGTRDSVKYANLTNPEAADVSFSVAWVKGVPAGRKQPTEADAKASLDAAGMRYQMKKFEKTKLAGGDGVLMEYSANVNGVDAETRQITVTKGLIGLVVVSSFVNADTMAEAKKIVEAMEKSITLK